MMKILLTCATAISILGLICETSEAIILDERDQAKGITIETFTVAHDGDPIPFGSNDDAHYMIDPLIHGGSLTIQNFSEDWQGTVKKSRDPFDDKTIIKARHPLGDLTITVSHNFPNLNHSSSYCYGELSSKWTLNCSKQKSYARVFNPSFRAITKNDCSKLFAETSKNTKIPRPVLDKVHEITKKTCKE